MIDPLKLLAADENVDGMFRDILANKPLSPAIGQFAMQDRLKLLAAMEGALIMLKDCTDPCAVAAATILKGAMV